MFESANAVLSKELASLKTCTYDEIKILFTTLNNI